MDGSRDQLQEPCLPAQKPPQQKQEQLPAAAQVQVTECEPVVCTAAPMAAAAVTAAPVAAAAGTAAPVAVAAGAAAVDAAGTAQVKPEPQLLLQDSDAITLLQEPTAQHTEQNQAADALVAAEAGDQPQQPVVAAADTDMCITVQGLEDQLHHLQHQYTEQQLLLQQQHQTQGLQAAAAGILADTAAAMADAYAQDGSSNSPDATVVLLQQQAAQAAVAEAEAAAAAAAIAAATMEHQQRIESAPLHKRAFEALVAAAAAEAEAAEAAESEAPAPRPPVAKKQRRGRGRSALAALTAPGDTGAAADACAYIAVPGQGPEGAADGYEQEDEAATVAKVGRLAEAVAAALAAAAAAGGEGSAQAAAAAAAGAYGLEGADASMPNGQAHDQYGAGFDGAYGGWGEGAWDGDWEGSGYTGEDSMQEGGVQRPGDPQRAMKKRLAASESYKRKKEQEANLTTYWSGLQVGCAAMAVAGK